MKDMSSIIRRHPMRIGIIVVLVAIAIFAVVRFAAGSNEAQASAANVAATTVVSTSGAKVGGSRYANGSGSAIGSGSSTRGGSGGCCGTSGATGGGAATQGLAQASGGVQKISVDLSRGYYDPSVLKLKAGVPAEITFGQSSGCTQYVQSQSLGFQADLGSGPQTIKLPALQPGTYDFECGMNMVTGQIVVE